MAGQQVESRWPYMFARPWAPGFGPRLYQATSPQRCGTWKSVGRESATDSTGALTPIRLMRRSLGVPGGAELGALRAEAERGMPRKRRPMRTMTAREKRLRRKI